MVREDLNRRQRQLYKTENIVREDLNRRGEEL